MVQAAVADVVGPPVATDNPEAAGDEGVSRMTMRMSGSAPLDASSRVPPASTRVSTNRRLATPAPVSRTETS